MELEKRKDGMKGIMYGEDGGIVGGVVGHPSREEVHVRHVEWKISAV